MASLTAAHFPCAGTTVMTDFCEGLGVNNSPSIVSKSGALDIQHLKDVTLGDCSLERQVLELFDRQAEFLIGRLRGATSPAVAGIAHTLCGSARAVGAWQVAIAAEALERATVERQAVASQAIASQAIASQAIAS